MENKKISRYPVPSFEEMPKDIQNMVSWAEKNYGFIPNVIKALAHRPAELRAFMGYNEALTNKESWLTPEERELMIVAFSGHNGCLYCVASHGAAHRWISENIYKADQVAVNYHEAEITPREKAIIDFSMKLTIKPAEMNENDFEKLRKQGLSDEDIWDVAWFTAFFNLSNRMMTFLAVKPDEEFYSMGK